MTGFKLSEMKLFTNQSSVVLLQSDWSGEKQNWPNKERTLEGSRVTLM